METILILTPNPVPSMRNRVFSRSWKNVAFQGCYYSHKFYQKQPPKRFSAITSNASGHFAATNLKTLANKIMEMSPHSLKEFPWKEAKDFVMDRSIYLLKEALKWSFIGLFIISFSSDVALAILRDREPLIPVGLFIGVQLADFLKEFLQEFLSFNKQKDGNVKLLLAIGSIFMFIKLISLPMKLQGKVMFSHIGNGGLMQVLWLARNLQQAEGKNNQNEQLLDSSQ